MVDIDDEVSEDDLVFVKHQLMQTSKRLANVKTDAYVGGDYASPHDISPEDIEEDNSIIAPNVLISDCQICVELSAKAIMKSLGVNPVERHEISFDHERVSATLGRLPPDRDFSKNVPRVFFLTQFWERFYQLSKYGLPEENITSFELLKASDAIRAIQDADFAHEVANDALAFALDKKGLDGNDLDL